MFEKRFNDADVTSLDRVDQRSVAVVLRKQKKKTRLLRTNLINVSESVRLRSMVSASTRRDPPDRQSDRTEPALQIRALESRGHKPLRSADGVSRGVRHGQAPAPLYDWV